MASAILASQEHINKGIPGHKVSQGAGFNLESLSETCLLVIGWGFSPRNRIFFNNGECVLEEAGQSLT